MDLLIADYRNAGGSKNTFPISMIPVEYLVTEDMEFQPVTDNKPYLGGNLSHVFSTNQVYQLYGFGGMVLLLLGIIIYFSLRKIGNPNIHGRSFNSVAVLALLLGTNFLLVEHHLVFVLFKIVYVFHDALMLGAVVFLILSGIGSIITNVKIRSVIIKLALGCYITTMLTHTLLPDWILLCLMLPVVIASGTFFPLLFEKAAKNPLGVFALDAIGAGLGSLLAAAIPILMGFQVYSYIALIIFSGTILMDYWFHKSETISSMNAIS
jgi:hypothetical protein